MFPDYLDGAKVLEYTDSGHFGFMTDYDEDGNPIDAEICYLAVCRYIGNDAYYLFSCDRSYNVMGDGRFDSIDVCKSCHPESDKAIWYQKVTPYLYTATQRKKRGGTIYFEFQRGRHRGKHWLERSVFLHADLFDQLNLFDIFSEALPHFNYYGPTEVTQNQYKKLKTLALAQGGEVAVVMEELDHWVQDCFYIENVFTICGI